MAIKRAVLVEAGHRCAIQSCRQVPVAVDHIDDWSKNNAHEFQNLIALCPTCHERKTQKTIDRQSMLRYEELLTQQPVPGSDLWLTDHGRDPDRLATNKMRYDAWGTLVYARVVWPDGSPGAFEVTASDDGAITTYEVTYEPNAGPGRRVIQPAVTRDEERRVVRRPALEVHYLGDSGEDGDIGVY